MTTVNLVMLGAGSLLGDYGFSDLTPFLMVAVVFALGMLTWDSVEVGRNDAANLVNAVFGSGVMRRRICVAIAAVGVIIGAMTASPVMETARKGIFDPALLTLEMALAVYLSVYIVDTVLLYGYSAFGMPVSTTACLVFELLGAALAMSFFVSGENGASVVKWAKASNVVMGIVFSILIAGAAAYVLQRLFRGVIGHRSASSATLRRHAGWIAGGMLSGILYFLIVKGMKHVSLVASIDHSLSTPWHRIGLVAAMWAVASAAIYGIIAIGGRRASKAIFPAMTILGMVAMAIAFGQNDLANCASPGLAAANLIQHSDSGVVAANKVPLSVWALGVCGLLMALGMTTRGAARVTESAVSTGSSHDTVNLWAPRWCSNVARLFVRNSANGGEAVMTARPTRSLGGLGERHYDALRAAVILSVSASVIATASGLGLPVSTTYVAFAAVIATGVADKVFVHGDANLKVARAIWVVFTWFAASVVAAVAAGIVASLLYLCIHAGWGIAGLLMGLAGNLAVRWMLTHRAEKQIRASAAAASERAAARKRAAMAAAAARRPVTVPAAGIVAANSEPADLRLVEIGA